MNEVFISKVITFIIAGNLEMGVRRVRKIFFSSHSRAWDKGGAPPGYLENWEFQDGKRGRLLRGRCE